MFHIWYYQLYVPKQLYSRFRAINHIAFKIRESSSKMVSTRVTLGKEDFILQKRDKNNSDKGWGEPVPLPRDLPDIEFSLQGGPLSPGEAPGRTALTPDQEERRKRKAISSSGSPSTPQHPPTKRIDMTLQEEIAAADLVSETTVARTPPSGTGLLKQPEVGSVTSVQGQSTPKIKPVHPFFDNARQEANRLARI